MKKIFVIVSAILILSGCSVSSNYTIGNDGSVTGTTTLSVPKRSVRNISTLEQWKQLLTKNDLAGPTESAEPNPSESPAPNCDVGENTEFMEWTYTCSATGDISVISQVNQVGSVGQLNFDRAGDTLTITQQATLPDGLPEDEDTDNPLGISGISLIYSTTTLTFPGLVTDVAGGAQKVDDNTVSFFADQTQKESQTATIKLDSVHGTPTSLSLSAKSTANIPSGANVMVTASLASPASGRVLVYVDENLFTEEAVGSDGTVDIPLAGQANGVHKYKAVFTPTDWFNVDKSQAELSLEIKTLNVQTMPKISGKAKVGAQLSVSAVKSSPAATGIAYQWLRNGKTISGKTGATYKLVSADFNKNISVKITLRKAGYLSVTAETMPLKITKR